jgi:hypothetical protein
MVKGLQKQDFGNIKEAFENIITSGSRFHSALVVNFHFKIFKIALK